MRHGVYVFCTNWRVCKFHVAKMYGLAGLVFKLDQMVHCSNAPRRQEGLSKALPPGQPLRWGWGERGRFPRGLPVEGLFFVPRAIKA